MNINQSNIEYDAFFDYILEEKLRLFQRLYPYFKVSLEKDEVKPWDPRYSTLSALGQQARSRLQLPDKLSFIDLIRFFQTDFEKIFIQKFDPSEGIQYGKVEKHGEKSGIPICALALRLTVEIFRVVSGDQDEVTLHSLINYVNTHELFPLSISQFLYVFDLVTIKSCRSSINDIKTKNQMTKSYNLIEFI